MKLFVVARILPDPRSSTSHKEQLFIIFWLSRHKIFSASRSKVIVYLPRLTENLFSGKYCHSGQEIFCTFPSTIKVSTSTTPREEYLEWNELNSLCVSKQRGGRFLHVGRYIKHPTSTKGQKHLTTNDPTGQRYKNRTSPDGKKQARKVWGGLKMEQTKFNDPTVEQRWFILVQ